MGVSPLFRQPCGWSGFCLIGDIGLLHTTLSPAVRAYLPCSCWSPVACRIISNLSKGPRLSNRQDRARRSDVFCSVCFPRQNQALTFEAEVFPSMMYCSLAPSHCKRSDQISAPEHAHTRKGIRSQHYGVSNGEFGDPFILRS